MNKFRATSRQKRLVVTENFWNVSSLRKYLVYVKLSPRITVRENDVLQQASYQSKYTILLRVYIEDNSRNMKQLQLIQPVSLQPHTSLCKRHI